MSVVVDTAFQILKVHSVASINQSKRALFGYGADPEAWLDIVFDLAAVILQGNHDAAVAGVQDVEYFNERARRTVELNWCASPMMWPLPDRRSSMPAYHVSWPNASPRVVDFLEPAIPLDLTCLLF